MNIDIIIRNSPPLPCYRQPWLVRLLCFKMFVNFTIRWAFYHQEKRVLKPPNGQCSMRKHYSFPFPLCECPFQRLHSVYFKQIRHLNMASQTMCLWRNWRACSIFRFRFGKSMISSHCLKTMRILSKKVSKSWSFFSSISTFWRNRSWNWFMFFFAFHRITTRSVQSEQIHRIEWKNWVDVENGTFCFGKNSIAWTHFPRSITNHHQLLHL